MRLLSSLLFLSLAALAQQNLFQPSIAEKPALKKAFAHIDATQDAIQAEWIKLTEIPAPSKEEKLRIEYMKAAMARVGLADIQQDAIGNVWGTYKGTGNGPQVVFAAHMDTVFPMDTPIKVKEINGRYHAPSIGDDTGALVALLHAFDAMKKNNVKTKGDIIFLASVQEEIGLLGAKFWLEARAKKPDMFLAVDSRLGGLGYGALRIEQYKFIFEAPAMHTLASRGKPNAARGAARAILALGEMKLPEPDASNPMNLPVVNVSTLGGGTVVNATPGRVFFTADVRALDTATEQKVVEEVKSLAQRAANQEGVQLKIENINLVHDYSKALPKEVRLNHPLVQTTLAVHDFLKLNGNRKSTAVDSGSDDHNIGVALGIPAIGIGAIIGGGAHSLEESAEKASIIPGAKYLILLSSTLAGVE